MTQFTLWLLLLLLAHFGWPTARAIDSQCSACEAVAVELQRRMDAEIPRAQLDMRHRLDKDGNRYGKVINYKVSEQRAVNLLDDLCSEMDGYTLIAQTDDSTDSNTTNSEQAAEAATGASTTLDEKNDVSAGPPLVWVKRKGKGATSIPTSRRPSKAEEDLRVKQLTTFCGMMLEQHEDEVLEALVNDQFAKQGVAPVLCQQISSKCKGKQYPELESDESESSSITPGQGQNVEL